MRMWQRVRDLWSVKPLRWAVGLFSIVGIVLLILWAIRTDHGCNFTGFGPCDFVEGSDEDYRPEKTLWDWLGLLIVPAVLALAAVYFNRAERRNELKIADQRTRTEHELADERLREEALQAYLDRMAELLIEHGLHTSKPDTEGRSVARARTLTVLRRLDGGRRGAVLQFLYESNVIIGDQPVIALRQADLTNVDLKFAFFTGVNLTEANLTGANLTGANLTGANLTGADLTEANLLGSNLSRAILEGANLSWAVLEGAILSRVILRGADLRGADLRGADLEGAILAGANLRGCNLSRANFSQAKLEQANLTGVILEQANLRGAFLTGAKLEQANLRGADLRGAFLAGANLTGATITQEQLDQARSL